MGHLRTSQLEDCWGKREPYRVFLAKGDPQAKLNFTGPNIREITVAAQMIQVLERLLDYVRPPGFFTLGSTYNDGHDV